MASDNIITTVTTAIQTIEDGEASQEQVLQAMEFVKRLQQVYWQLKERMESAAMKYIEKHGDIEDGDRRVYIAPNRTTKCKNNRDTLAAVLEAAGGDVDALVEVLASDAFKPGATKKLVGALKGEQLFETKVTKNIKTGEPSQPKLQDVDLSELKRFAR